MRGVEITIHDRVWAMLPPAQIRAGALPVARGLGESLDRPGEPQRVDGVAVFDVVGPLAKRRSFFDRLFGLGGPTMPELAAEIQRAADDSGVGALLLRIDSPGGTVAGTKQLADAVFAVRGRKPIVAFIEDTGASAAYYVASQADEVVVGEAAQVGGIGTFAFLVDSSKAAEEAGIEVVTFRSTPLKGAGLPGTALTEAERADFQRLIDDWAGVFVEDVARGRGLTLADAQELHDGTTHIGRKAVERGLADRVGTFDEVLAELTGGEAGPIEQPDIGGEEPLEEDEMEKKGSAGSPPADDRKTVARRVLEALGLSPKEVAEVSESSGVGGLHERARRTLEEVEAARATADERLRQLESRQAELEVDALIAGLGDRVTPAMEKAGLRALLLSVRSGETKVDGRSAFEVLGAVLAAAPDLQLTGGELAGEDVAASAPSASHLSEERLEELEKRYPTTFQLN